MKKVFTVLVIASVFVIAGCAKGDTKCNYTDVTVTPPAAEIDSLRQTLEDSSIIATEASAGFFYKINNAGSGTGIANLCTTLTVTYRGTFFSGQVFDSTAAGSTATLQLGQVILGWQKALPLISKGGDMTLYIPPTLAYGSNAVKDNSGNVVIPAKSYLIFDVHIVDIQ